MKKFVNLMLKLCPVHSYANWARFDEGYNDSGFYPYYSAPTANPVTHHAEYGCLRCLFARKHKRVLVPYQDFLMYQRRKRAGRKRDAA